MVPSDAASRPSDCQICRTKAATEVLPLVPVTAAIVSGWRGKSRAAAWASAARASATLTKGAPASGGSASATTAAAPRASASPIYLTPSSFTPGKAKKTSPGCTLRLSKATPATSAALSPSSASLRSTISPSRIILLLAGFVGVGSIPQTGDDGEWLRRRLFHRRRALERLDPADECPGDPPRVVGGRVEAVVLGRWRRIVVDREVEVFRLVGRRDRHEGCKHLVLRIVAVDDFVGRAGLAADVVAGDVGEARRAVGRVRPQKIAHRFRRLLADDAMARFRGLLLSAR